MAGPHKRFAGLAVNLSGPGATVTSIDALKFTAIVTNYGAEPVKILKYGTILDDKLPTRSFAVEKDGTTVPFRGVKLSVSLDDVDDSAFTIIPAGESVTVRHDVTSLYDFASVGTGNFSFQPVTNFQILGTNETFKTVKQFNKIAIEAESMVVQVTKDISKRELPQVNKRAVDICTAPEQKAFIDDSYIEGKSLAAYGASYINANGANELYKAYWGNTTTSRVLSVFNAVANENSSSRTIFFQEVPTIGVCSRTTVAARNIRGGTTLHELTHALSGTSDVSYGCAANQALSDSDKFINADNYNCFATQVYANTRCG
ncbi:hypothetical protein H0H81_011035 [Sphagnurus paluster]|uniref:deuterolysin n=1 Tax=Sphagnurus paluster TaxID=117069 RepID=A0A9P7FUE5_9AGAR|nr:hypothetical protein H0H81_011035 [Sphagnurus paluster]